jgi:putative sigma-54 modulation protein
MQVFVRGKQLRLTSAVRAYAEEKIGHLAHYIENIIDAHVTIRLERKTYIVDVTLNLPHFVIKAEDREPNMMAAIDLVRDSLERQILKYKTKHWLRHHHRGNDKNGEVQVARGATELELEDEGESTPRIAKVKRFTIKPMHEDEAAKQMELLGHDFFVFLNADTEQVNVLYKRKTGDLGLLEPVR